MKLKLLSPKKSIKSQLIISFLIPFLVFAIVICLFFMKMMSNTVNNNIVPQFNSRLEDNSKALEKNLDPGLINHVMESPQEYGRNLEVFLDSFNKDRKGIQFTYVLSRKDGKDVIVALNGSSSFMGEQQFTSAQKKAFEQKEVVFSSIYKDKWGVHKSIFVPVEGADAIIGMDMDAAFIDKLQTQMILYPSIFLLIAVVIGLVLAIYIGNRISKPLQKVVGYTKTVAGGNLSESNRSDRQDEIGELANSFEEMRLNLSSIIDNVRGNSQTINESSNILFTSFEELAGASQQIVDSTNEEVTGSEERAKHIEKISNMISDMTSAIENMDTQTKQIKDVTFNTSKLSQEGSEQVQMVSEQINKIKNNGLVTKENLSDLNNKLEHINKIIVLISEISSQTNLLSLNASIEAARAGEAGKGFSVVAQEIQKLANQTATSTQDISNIVNEINKQTDKVLQLNQQDFEDIVEGVELVEQNGRLFNEIFHSVEELKTRSESIFESSENIAKASDSTLSSIQEIVAISEEGLANTEEIAASATQQNYTVETLKQQNELLTNVANTLQETVGKFHTGNELKEDHEESISED